MVLRVAYVIALCVLLSDARRLNSRMRREYDQFEDQFREWTKVFEERTAEFKSHPTGLDDVPRARWSDRSGLHEELIKEPPPIDQAAQMARYIVNQADWAAVATISTRKDIETFPTANLISIGDGPVGNGTGMPYMYLTPLDYTAQDLAMDHRATLLVSLVQGNYCSDKEWDPMDPRCARVMLTGKIIAVKNTTDEHEVVKRLFFERHPKLKNMPSNHEFFFTKMKILAIAMLDTFGGPKYISTYDYFNPSTKNNLI